MKRLLAGLPVDIFQPVETVLSGGPGGDYEFFSMTA